VKRVLVECRDLFFRGKLQVILTAAGAEPVREEPYDLAVIELGKPDVSQRITDLVARGVPVLAFGSHVDAAALRAARDLGARAVPNSEIETALRALLRL
jgi:sirohydrochlorin ferrochelatase